MRLWGSCWAWSRRLPDLTRCWKIPAGLNAGSNRICAAPGLAPTAFSEFLAFLVCIQIGCKTVRHEEKSLSRRCDSDVYAWHYEIEPVHAYTYTLSLGTFENGASFSRSGIFAFGDFSLKNMQSTSESLPHTSAFFMRCLAALHYGASRCIFDNMICYSTFCVPQCL